MPVRPSTRLRAPEAVHTDRRSEGASESVFQPGRLSNAFEIEPCPQRIQFAAANRVCVALSYCGKMRTVEPLSFRRSMATSVKRDM